MRTSDEKTSFVETRKVRTSDEDGSNKRNRERRTSDERTSDKIITWKVNKGNSEKEVGEEKRENEQAIGKRHMRRMRTSNKKINDEETRKVKTSFV